MIGSMLSRRTILLLACMLTASVAVFAQESSRAISSVDEIETGWYRIKCVADNASSEYVNR